MKGFIKISSSLLFAGALMFIAVWLFLGSAQFFGFPPKAEIVQADTETKYASSHITGDFSNPNNAVGATTGTWSGDLNTNSNYTSRWAMADPSGSLTGTQTISVLARKGSNSNTPTIAINLYENGSLVQSIVGATDVTSTVGQTISGTFNASAVTNGNNVEIEVVEVGAGGSPSARNSAQIDYIQWSVSYNPPTPDLSWSLLPSLDSAFLIYQSSSLSFGSGTLVCSTALTDNNGDTSTCSSGSISANTQYRIEAVLLNNGDGAANMASGDFVDHVAVKAGWAGTSPTLGSCAFSDTGGDDGSTSCSVSFNGNDVRITNTGGGNVVLASSGGQEKFAYLITTDSDVPSADSTSYMDASIDSNIEDSSKITISGPSSNSLPVASSVSIDSGAASITLTESDTKIVSCVGTVTDDDGYTDITSVTADFFRTSRGIGSALDNNDHYQRVGDSQCVPSGGSGTTETYTCSFSVWYYADPTDAGSPNSSDDWTCTMTPSDSEGTGTASSDTIEMDSLVALAVLSAPINYGTINPGADTGSNNKLISIENTGNRDMDPQISGDSMCTDYPTCSGGSIAVSQQKYDTSNITYASLSFSLSGTPTTRNLDLPQRTVSSVTDELYWGIAVPDSTPAGTYSGVNTFTATAGI